AEACRVCLGSSRVRLAWLSMTRCWAALLCLARRSEPGRPPGWRRRGAGRPSSCTPPGTTSTKTTHSGRLGRARRRGAPTTTPCECPPTANGHGSAVGPGSTGTSVVLDGDRVDALTHPGGVEPSIQVVDLVPGQTRERGVQDGHHLPPVQPSVGDFQPERTGYKAADVEEAQAALILLVGFG